LRLCGPTIHRGEKTRRYSAETGLWHPTTLCILEARGNPGFSTKRQWLAGGAPEDP
jgi:hypothetical protein